MGRLETNILLLLQETFKSTNLKENERLNKDLIANLCIKILDDLNYSVMLNYIVDENEIRPKDEKKSIALNTRFLNYKLKENESGVITYVRCD